MVNSLIFMFLPTHMHIYTELTLQARLPVQGTVGLLLELEVGGQAGKGRWREEQTGAYKDRLEPLSVPTASDLEGVSVLQNLRPLLKELMAQELKKGDPGAGGALGGMAMPHTSEVITQINSSVRGLQKFSPNLTQDYLQWILPD